MASLTDSSLYFHVIKILLLFNILQIIHARPYDPDDQLLDTVLPEKGPDFEAFYAREAYGVASGSSRPAHGHATFYQHRNPALVDTNNSPAYGYRFDGGRRFNFD